MYRPRIRLPRIGLIRPPVRRSIHHHVPPLKPAFANGIGDFLSAEAVDISWREYMGLMVGRLNELIAGTQYEHKDLLPTIFDTAREPSLAPIFNHASMAHNNSFFFRYLSSTPVAMPKTFRTLIDDNFSSVETLQREFAATASAMFGPGFVWLVKTNVPNRGRGSTALRILPTYLAGSPYPDAHWRRQGTDMNTVGGATPEAQGPVVEYLNQQAGVFRAGKGDKEEKRSPGGVEVVPLLCLNTWEHVWLRDYGFGHDGHGGKTMYAERWWNHVDWELVASDANIQPRRSLQY